MLHGGFSNVVSYSSVVYHYVAVLHVCSSVVSYCSSVVSFCSSVALCVISLCSRIACLQQCYAHICSSHVVTLQQCYRSLCSSVACHLVTELPLYGNVAFALQQCSMLFVAIQYTYLGTLAFCIASISLSVQNNHGTFSYVTFLLHTKSNI